MSNRRNLRLSVGELKCDVTGFDDPLAVLARVIELFAKTAPGGVWAAQRGGPSEPALRAEFEALVRREADAIGAEFSLKEGYLTFARKTPPADAAEGASTRVFKAPPGFAAEVERMRAQLRNEGERRPAAPDAQTRAKEIRVRNARPCESGAPIPYAAFLRGANTRSLSNLLEAAAAWLAVSEGKTAFSSRDAFTALTAMESAAGMDGKYGWTARKSAFLDLIEEKSFRLVEEGKYALSRETLCAYERRLRA